MAKMVEKVVKKGNKYVTIKVKQPGKAEPEKRPGFPAGMVYESKPHKKNRHKGNLLKDYAVGKI